MGESPHKIETMPTDGGAAQGTTTFTASTEAVSYLRQSSSADPQNDVDIEVDDIKDVAAFLAKPVNVASGVFTTADPVNATLTSSDIFTLLNAQTIWVNKLQGFLNIRGNVKFRLVINPTPFQAGLLFVGYFPCANQMTNEMNAHLFNRDTVSQIPGTYLNLNNNFCEITVPYIAPTTFLARDQVLSGDHVSWGQIVVRVFEPLRTGTGPTSVNWTLWMSIEDLELSGMVQPQMAEAPRKRKGRNPIDAEQNSGKGPVAKVMSSGVQLAEDLSAFPLLAPIATPASWVLAALGGLAESFGWSKPTLNEGPCPMSRNVHAYTVNSDTNDNCQPLALRSDNKLSAITDASPGGVDEMSINFIKTRWAYFNDFAWTTAGVTGDLLYSHRVQPDAYQRTYTVGGAAIATNTPAGALSKFYNHYRGSFEYRLRIVKTGFHTGTLAVTWTPGEAAVAPTFAQTPYMYRQIIDIQEGSEFIFNLPYLVSQDYLQTNEYMGVFTVHIVNPLLAPATVASTVDVMVEVRGGPDLTYVNPAGTYDAVPFVPQGIEVENGGEATALTMGSSRHDFDSIHHAMIANGEIQLSVSDLLKAATVLRMNSTTSFSASNGDPVKVATNQIYACRYNGVGITASELGGDLISFIGSWYALQRGSQRWRFMPCEEGTAGNTFKNFRAMYMPRGNTNPDTFFRPTPTNADTWSALLNSENGGAIVYATGRVFQMNGQNGGIAVQTPYYSRYRYSLSKWVSAPAQIAGGYSTSGSLCIANKAATRILTTRSLGDDFQFSYFVGIPTYCSANVAGWANLS
jgi:hypothetical protein